MICCELVVNRSHFIECSGTSFNGFKCLQTRMVDRFFRVFVSTARVIRNAYDFRDFLKILNDFTAFAGIFVVNLL